MAYKIKQETNQSSENFQESDWNKFESLHAWLDSEAWEEYSERHDTSSQHDCCSSNDLHYACIDGMIKRFIVKYMEEANLKESRIQEYSYWSLDDEGVIVESGKLFTKIFFEDCQKLQAL